MKEKKPLSSYNDRLSSFLDQDEFFNSESKKNILDTLHVNDISDLEFSLVEKMLERDVILKYVSAKRRIFYKQVAKKVPIIVDHKITTKKIGEHGAMLPILEEKSVENPDDHNTKVRASSSNAKKVDYKSIFVDEELPPEPLELDIVLPYSLYAFMYLDQNDPNYRVMPFLQNIKIIVSLLSNIQKCVNENISVRVSFSNCAMDENNMLLAPQEAEKWSNDIFQRIKGYLGDYDNLNLHLLPKTEYTGKVLFIAGFHDYPVSDKYPHISYSRELGILRDMFGKSPHYMTIDRDDYSSNFLLGSNLIDSYSQVFGRVTEYMRKLFVF